MKRANPIRIVERDLSEHIRQENAAYRAIIQRQGADPSGSEPLRGAGERVLPLAGLPLREDIPCILCHDSAKCAAEGCKFNRSK